MDIAQLKKISEVLSRNFFKELANDIDLINENEETEEEIIKNKAVAQFFNVVPDVLKKIGKSAPIVFYKSDSDCCVFYSAAPCPPKTALNVLKNIFISSKKL